MFVEVKVDNIYSPLNFRHNLNKKFSHARGPFNFLELIDNTVGGISAGYQKIHKSECVLTLITFSHCQQFNKNS